MKVEEKKMLDLLSKTFNEKEYDCYFDNNVCEFEIEEYQNKENFEGISFNVKVRISSNGVGFHPTVTILDASFYDEEGGDLDASSELFNKSEDIVEKWVNDNHSNGFERGEPEWNEY